MTATRIAPIPEPFDALAARVALIDEATSRLDLQYYEWDSDNVGYLLLGRLIAAADRGVAVRLLVDDLRFRKRTYRAASLSLHPNIAVRLLNPLWSRRSNVFTEAVDFVRRFSQLNRRMHNKLLIADRDRAIVARRNADAIDALTTPDNAWRVGLDRDGRLTWTDAAETTPRQPARSPWQRIADRFYELLPIKRYI